MLRALPAVRRRAGGDDPLHRHERRHHRRVAHHVLDGDLPADARGLPAPASAAQDAVHRARALRGHRADRDPAPGRRQLRRDAVLARRDALVHGRARVDRASPDASPIRRVIYRARPNLRLRGVDWPLFAIVGGIATGISFLVILVQNPLTRWVGLGWIVARLRRVRRLPPLFVHAPLTETVKAPPAFGPALALEYRQDRSSRSSPGGRPTTRSTSPAAWRPSAARAIVALTVLEVPLELPLDAELPERGAARERRARRGGRDRRARTASA